MNFFNLFKFKKPVINQPLINALTKSVEFLERLDYWYAWTDSASCNCGILAQQIMNCNGSELRKDIDTSHGLWSDGARYFEQCRKTGVPINIIFQKFYEIGLTSKDIIQLENLSNKKIIRKAKLENNLKIGDKDNLIKYMKAWIELLQNG